MEFKVNCKGLWLSVFLRSVLTCIVIGLIFGIISMINGEGLSLAKIINFYLLLLLFLAVFSYIYILYIQASKIYISHNTLHAQNPFGIERTIELKRINHIYKHGFLIDNITIQSDYLFSSYRQILIYQRTQNLDKLLNLIKQKVRPCVRTEITKIIE